LKLFFCAREKGFEPLKFELFIMIVVCRKNCAHAVKVLNTPFFIFSISFDLFKEQVIHSYKMPKPNLRNKPQS